MNKDFSSPTSMKVLAIVPDYIEKPSGGLGEQFRNLMQRLDDRVEYFITEYPEENSIKTFIVTGKQIGRAHV